jgi:hypothetical protein
MIGTIGRGEYLRYSTRITASCDLAGPGGTETTLIGCTGVRTTGRRRALLIIRLG